MAAGAWWERRVTALPPSGGSKPADKPVADPTLVTRLEQLERRAWAIEAALGDVSKLSTLEVVNGKVVLR
jgi:hypothetical protein